MPQQLSDIQQSAPPAPPVGHSVLAGRLSNNSYGAVFVGRAPSSNPREGSEYDDQTTTRIAALDPRGLISGSFASAVSVAPNRQVFDVDLLGSGQQGLTVDWSSYTRVGKSTIDGEVRLNELRRFYTIVGADEPLEVGLSGMPESYWLLRNAVEPIRAAFGNTSILQLRAQESDDDLTLKVVIVQSDKTNDQLEEALNEFDTAWWLRNCGKSSSSVVFDYSVRPTATNGL